VKIPKRKKEKEEEEKEERRRRGEDGNLDVSVGRHLSKSEMEGGIAQGRRSCASTHSIISSQKSE